MSKLNRCFQPRNKNPTLVAIIKLGDRL